MFIRCWASPSARPPTLSPGANGGPGAKSLSGVLVWSMVKRWILVAACLVLVAACNRKAPDTHTANNVQTTLETTSGAVSARPVAEVRPTPADVLTGTNWPAQEVTSGQAWLSCQHDVDQGDGTAVHSLEFFSVVDVMTPCREPGTIRLRYRGKIAADFTALVERMSAMADRMDIKHRILDIDSSGGRVEDAMRAGDSIGNAGWTVWVRDDAVCHSACVLILAAGDDRLITGKVGIHRMVRIGSKASTRAELSGELRDVHDAMKEYLERNGASVAVADLMMTVPNRQLRILTVDELHEFGLDGANAAQDDLERIRLARKCGEDFPGRLDAFASAFDSECKAEDRKLEEVKTCGLALQQRFGFPDAKCVAEGPMSEYQ
jgi:hypothetical protein